VTQDGQVTGVRTSDGFLPADAVICTVPTPLLRGMVPDLPADWRAKYDAIRSIGACCLLFKLKRSVTPHFWVILRKHSAWQRDGSEYQVCFRKVNLMADLQKIYSERFS
jgi:hypothetical protein